MELFGRKRVLAYEKYVKPVFGEKQSMLANYIRYTLYQNELVLYNENIVIFRVKLK